MSDAASGREVGALEASSVRRSFAWKKTSNRKRHLKPTECIVGKNILIALGNVLLIAGMLLADYELTYYSDLQPDVAKGLALIFFVLLLYFGGEIFSTSKRNKLLGYGGILIIIIVQSFIIWRGTASHLLR